MDREDRLIDRLVDFYRGDVKVTCAQNLFRLACYYGSLKIAKFLYEKGVNPDDWDEDNEPYVDINEVFDSVQLEDDPVFYLEADMYHDCSKMDGMFLYEIAEKYGKNPELTSWMKSCCNGE